MKKLFEIISRKKAGFTMLEMMIVVVVIGIFAAMATPMLFSSIPKLKSRAEARNILSMLRIARGRAVSENLQYGVYLDTSNKQYFIFMDSVNPSLSTYDVGDSIVMGPQIMERDVVFASQSFGNNCVVFMPNGGASQSGSVTVNTYSSSAPYTVSVLASTGKARMQ